MAGRRIFLFSDGTGNSAGKITKTNVWRLFQAINLQDPNCLAFYDDGVGTGGFRGIKVLGGAFGFGLARNVRQLYEHLCRNYGGPDDEIILCGFSRGAFTVRVLSGMIDRYGIIDRSSTETIEIAKWHRLSTRKVAVATDEGLKAAIFQAYKTMRRESSQATLWKMANWLRRVFGSKALNSQKFGELYGVKHEVRIKFLGVFDTVSAYGLPVDEMAIVIHKYLFPLRFPDMKLSEKVDNAVQALAIDETRHTFHPVLWTEKRWNSDEKKVVSDEKPVQVWFPGVHADVGGGYADERLSLVPALWMAQELQRCTGLKLRDTAIADLRERGSELGALHDSRSGLGLFYRYKPRMLNQLGKEDLDGNGHYEVEIDAFKIHQSVFERIKATGADYAPLGIPADYKVVRETIDAAGQVESEIVSADDAGYESETEREARIEAMRGIGDLIFCRKLLYYVMMGSALTVVVLPMLWLTDRAVIPTGFAASLVGLFAQLLDYLPLPGSERIGLFWIQHAEWFCILCVGFLLAFVMSANLARAIQRQAQSAWGHLTSTPIPNLRRKAQWIEFWRSFAGPLHRWWSKKVFPILTVLLLFVVLPAIPIFRWYLFTPLGGQSVCAQAQTDEVNKFFLQATGLEFQTTDTCMETDVILFQGHDYKITITVEQPWRDGIQPREVSDQTGFPASPQGLDWEKLTWQEQAEMTTFTLTRRFWSEDWMGLMGSIGRGREHAFRVDAVQNAEDDKVFEYEFHAWRSGRLYLFVNDALNAPLTTRWCQNNKDDERQSWDCYYANNQGSAKIDIKLVREP